MSNVVVNLGGVTFRDFEVPEMISVWNGQRLGAQDLIGSGQIVSSIGFDSTAISFSGIFSGANAASRVWLLDLMRTSGVPVPLFWDRFFYLVFVSDFTFEYWRENFVPFSVGCVSTLDPAAEVAALATSALAAVTLDVGRAIDLSSVGGIPIDATAASDPASLAGVQGAVLSSIPTVDARIGDLSTSLGAAAAPADGAALLNQLTASAGQLAGLTGMSGYVNRAARNISGVLT